MFDQWLDKLVPVSYTSLGYRLRRSGWDDLADDAMAGKTVVVTGANAGLGRATAEALAGMGARLVMICRDPDRGEVARAEIAKATGNDAVELVLADMSRPSEVKAAADQIIANTARVDVLVSNAGVLLNARQTTPEGLEKTFATNTLGGYLITELLLPTLIASKPSRIIQVTSGGMYTARVHLADLQWERRSYDGVRAYAETKRAQVLLVEHWAEKLSGSGVVAAAVHPGWADTDGVRVALPRFHTLTRPFLRTTEQGADTIIWLAARPEFPQSESGALWFDRLQRPKHQMKGTHNTADEREELVETCRALTGV